MEFPSKFTDILAQVYESSSEDAKVNRHEELMRVRDILERKCESPIEFLLGAFIAPITDSYNHVEYRQAIDGTPATFGTFWTSQQSIGEYRADFLFRLMCEGHEGFLVVECDGHDFHERTKQQAQRDRSRDRKMTARGLTVIRFTGSEIFADPQKCADHVEEVLGTCMDRLVAAAGHISFENPTTL